MSIILFCVYRYTPGMRYLPVSSTLTMFHRFCLKYVDTRSVTMARFSSLHHTIQDRRVRYFNDNIRSRIEKIANNTTMLLPRANLYEIRRAPTIHFWANMAGAAAFFAPPVLSMIHGYSPFLIGLELKCAATYCSFVEGMSFMQYTLKKDVTWCWRQKP